MTHARQQLRDLAITAITGLTTTGANVHNGRVFPLEVSDMPAWVLSMDDADGEESQTVDMDGLQERAVAFAFAGVARETTGELLTDKLDLMAEELEVAIGGSLAGALSVELTDTRFDIADDELDHAIGSVVLVYVVRYQTFTGIPGTLE